MKSITLLPFILALQANAGTLQTIIEQKYGKPLERFEVIDVSPTTKVLWFDWEKTWWGGMNVVETTKDGKALYWHDILQPPSAQSIERIRVVTVNGRKLVEVIDRTHMGNGRLYLYEIRKGFVRRALDARIMSNGRAHFKPRVAHIEYRDIDEDGDEDVVLKATCLQGPIIDRSARVVGTYHREFVFEKGSFRELRQQRRGEDWMME